ncbi:MAG: MazG-like family protein, partial [Candidatus Kariarchaeaceae archaeon]
MHYTDLNTRVQQLNQKIGGNWDPQYQLLWVMEELGEVSREFLKTATLPAKGVDKIDSEPDTEKLQEEIGDV